MRTAEYLDREVETASLKLVQRLQEARLAKQLDYLFARSLFYQEKFQAARIRRKDYRRLGDLARFPFTTKEELRESQAACPPLGKHVAAHIDDIIRVHSSTGTTGKPSFVGLTRRDAKVWTRLTARSFYTQGLRKPDIVIHAAGLTLFVAGLSSKDAIESVGAMFVPIGTGASEKALMAIQLLRATAMHCTPSYATYFADWIRREAGLEPRELGLKKLFCGAEPGAGIPAVRARLQQDWGARVTEGLGNADMAPIIFSECPDQSGMHFNGQEFVRVEIIDPESGEVLPIEAGATGELVYTSLERECVPLLRFRTRDRVAVLGTSCSCGRTSFKLRCIGRTDDMLIVLGVNVFPSAVKEIVSSFHPRTTGEIQVVLDEPGPKVVPPLKVVAEYATGCSDLPALKDEIERKIKATLSVSASVDLVPAGTLPRYEMKGQLVKKAYEDIVAKTK
ncbi:MAG: phenylacetate--CoA ligase family protein [Acidobacteriia bacterium]|nr:phenylacetate--CoA ligase family protein [Terriglobia bacterium]